MNEWVDFGLYSLQAVLLWWVLPQWGATVLHPTATANGAAPLHRGGWTRVMRAWAALSVLALLACRLDTVPQSLATYGLHAPGWQALLMTSNLFLALGLLLATCGAWAFLRWLKGSATQDEPAAEIFPLTRDDFLPRALRYAVYSLTLVALFARPVAGLIRPDRVQGIWGNSVMGLVIALLLFFTAAGSLARQPNHLDRALGPHYRRLEISLCYQLMASLALLELGGLALELSGLGSRRHVALLVTAFVSLTMGSFMLFSRAGYAAPFATSSQNSRVSRNASSAKVLSSSKSMTSRRRSE